MNWSFLVLNKKQIVFPDCYRTLLGPDLIIIVLTMSSVDRRERILERHQGNVQTADMFDVRGLLSFSILVTFTFFQHFEKIMEGVQENEPNTIELKVDSAMTRDQVVAEIMHKVEELNC